MTARVPELNWSGSYAYRARRLHEPSSLEQVAEIVAGAGRVRVLGTRHSFTGIGDSDELISMARLPGEVHVAPDLSTVAIPAGLTYAEIAEALSDHGLAPHNTASLPHVSVGGAIATATHGSGDHNGNLATAVAALELVTGAGEVMRIGRGESDFEGMVVNLGALGAVTRVTLDVQPAYELRQHVFAGLGWDAVDEHFDEITSAGYSVSMFTTWDAEVEQTWVKSRVGDDSPGLIGALFGAKPARAAVHPIAGCDPADCTAQMGDPGPWSDRLPHFRRGFRASSGEEIQSEYHVPRQHGLAAIAAVRQVGELIRPVLQVSEIRTVAADDLWMSPQYGRDTVSFHFTWTLEPDAVRRAVTTIEAALEPFDPRPHWGKLFLADAESIGPRYERYPDFIALVERLDPRGVFRNEWFATHVLGQRS